eukprot:TRINITY_DN4963_c0_g1_i2.p1 TRINITY_DN4963_c0_g1~~TRINITY_DN4963_c0_g1_i2.p1  ORF type:complete len:601 (+),score=137.70 TRINITY_DN4963_c0_g1_i2:50-1804(+)
MPFAALKELAAAVREESQLGVEIKAFNLTARDGVKLWTIFGDVEQPTAKVPTVIIRSPYGPEGTENFADLFFPFGFNVVEQNQRGTGQSEGNFTFWTTCANDEADLIEWILKQEWSNGQVYVMGASADGINAVLAMRDQQIELGQWLIFTLGYAYPAVFQGGALKENLAKKWLHGMHDYRPLAPSYYETMLLPHEGLSPWWGERTLTNDSTVTFPSIFWGGWYDIFLQPMIDTFQAYDYKSDDPHHTRMIIGPRGHCLTAHPFLFPDDRYAEVWSYETAVSIFSNGTLPSEAQQLQKRAFARYLGTDVESLRSAKDLDRLTLYVMGPSRGSPPRVDDDMQASKPVKEENVTGLYWTTVADFPKTTTRSLYLHSNGGLLEGVPESAQQTYVYDPSKPVPTQGGNNLYLSCGPVDQTDVEDRSDVLLYTSGPFIEDTAIVGRIRVTLYVSSDQVDTDFTVKITDVYPILRGGASVLIGDTIQRMRWRNGDEKDKMELIKKGEVYEITLELWPTAYIFNKGHRLRLAVSSSNYPRFSANPNNGLPLVNTTGPLLVANNTIYSGQDHPSLVELPIAEMSAIPKNVPLP